jgi:hypothetical protein
MTQRQELLGLLTFCVKKIGLEMTNDATYRPLEFR